MATQVILLERIEKLGQMGDVVSVKPGYARNYLLPQKKAQRATKANLAHFQQQRAQLEAQNLERKNEATAIAAKMENLTVVIVRAASESGQLYGSVTARDIAEAVTQAGFSILRNQVVVETSVKTLGFFSFRVRLHAEVDVRVNINVAQSEEEAIAQAARVSKGEAAVLSTAQREAKADSELARQQVAAIAEAVEEADNDLEDAPQNQATDAAKDDAL